MRNLVLAAACAICVQALYAGDVVSGVTLSQDAVTKLVTVNYALSRDAVVTLAIEADGVEIERKYLADSLGDVNRRVVATGAGEVRTILWKPTSSWMPVTAPTSLRAIVRVWPDSSPPDWLVCDLRTKRTSYYETEDEIPSGCVTNRLCKTEVLVMKKMHAAGVTWWMGDPSNTGTGANPYRKIRFTRDYYISVYPTTQRQVTWLRDGTINAPSANDVLPALSAIVSEMNNTHLPTYRTTTGLALSLPTSAQWEYACRAGTAETRFCAESELGEYAWIPSNSGNVSHEVGTRKPNPWGLYDMLGNMNEYTADYYSGSVSSSTVTEDDPAGPLTGTKWVYRGGSYMDNIQTATSQFANGYSSISTSLGFRLAITLPQAEQ